MSASSESRGKRWCATLFVYDQDLVDTLTSSFEAGTLTKFVCQEEKCPDSGRLHLQLFLTFASPKRFRQVKDLLGDTSHIELAKGNDKQNQVYCTKVGATGNFRVERGTFTGGQGARSDLEEVVMAIQESKGLVEIATTFPTTYIKYHRGIEKLIEVHREQAAGPYRDMCCIVLTGQSRIGKSLWVRQYAHNLGLRVYSKPIGDGRSTQWFDGYDGEEILLLDDFEPGQVPFREFLIWTDVYKHRVAVKGGFVTARWTTVCVTSNIHPDDWWNQELFGPIAREPLRRRLDLVYDQVQPPNFMAQAYENQTRRVGRTAWVEEVHQAPKAD